MSSPSTLCLEEVSSRCIRKNANTEPYMVNVAEDVLGDLGVRQAMRGMPKNARL